MFHCIVCFCLLAVVSGESYFFKAPEGQNTVTLPSQHISAFSQSEPEPAASQQQVISHQHTAEPVIHYISYQTPAEVQQILQQLIGSHIADLDGQASTFNLNNQQHTSNVQSQYVAETFSHVKNHIHTAQDNRDGSVSNADSLAGYLPPATKTIVSNDFPTATSNVNSQFTSPTALNVEPEYHVPVPANIESPYVVDLPSATTLNSQYLLPAISNVGRELQAPDAPI